MRLQAILEIPLRKRHAVAYNLNPMHRDLNRSADQPIRSARRNRHALVRQPIILNEGSRP
jgi:cobalamin biosynthesis protein CobT